MRRAIVTAAALLVLAITALGGVHATTDDVQACIPAAVVLALS